MFVYHHWECTLIYRPLSYTRESLNYFEGGYSERERGDNGLFITLVPKVLNDIL